MSWVGWRCQMCRHEFQGNRRFCPQCGYTVYDPIQASERPDWAAEVAERSAEVEAQGLSRALLLKGYRGFADQVDAMARKIRALDEERALLVSELAEAVLLPGVTDTVVLLGEVRGQFDGKIRAVEGHGYVNGYNECACGEAMPTIGAWSAHTRELRAAGVPTSAPAHEVKR